MKLKLIILFTLSLYATKAISQPKGKALQIFNLINEARVNPKIFLSKYKTKINEYEPKFIPLLEKSSPIERINWDDNLALNCKQRVYGNLKPKYMGVNKMCGISSGNGFGFLDKETLYFVCDSYIHVLNEDVLYFGFYIDLKGHAYSWGSSCDTRKINFEFNETIDSSKVDFTKINTAVDELEINEMDKVMIQEINFVRQYPKVYASIVASYLSNKSNNSMSGLKKEEYDAGIELIDELKVMSPMQLLFPKKCVYEAAKKHGEDCKKRGFIDHTGSDKSTPFSRISNFCPDLSGNENIVGGRKNVRYLVIQLLIDSGISGRGHRYNILNPSWKYVGCYGYDGGNMYNYIQNFAK